MLIIIALLLHDVEEDTQAAICRLAGKDEKDYKRQAFQGYFVAELVGLLSRQSFVWNKENGCFDVKKKYYGEYVDGIKSSFTATKAKYCDVIANLSSDARRLEACFTIESSEAEKIIANIKKYLDQVKEFILPIEQDNYPKKLYPEMQKRISKIQTRLNILEIWLHGGSFVYFRG